MEKKEKSPRGNPTVCKSPSLRGLWRRILLLNVILLHKQGPRNLLFLQKLEIAFYKEKGEKFACEI